MAFYILDSGWKILLAAARVFPKKMEEDIRRGMREEGLDDFIPRGKAGRVGQIVSEFVGALARSEDRTAFSLAVGHFGRELFGEEWGSEYVRALFSKVLAGLAKRYSKLTEQSVEVVYFE